MPAHDMSTSESKTRAELPETLSWDEIRRPLVRSTVALGALIGAGLIGVWSADSSTPGSSSIEAGFARDTAAHHAQGVEMSFTILGKNPSTDVRDLAQSVATNESEETGQVTGWLQEWGLSQKPDGPRMTWMRKAGHQHAGLPPGATLLPDGRMPGTASPAQLAQLKSSTGRAAEVQYLQLMLLHDEASIQMARAAQSASNQQSVVQFSGTAIRRDHNDIKTIRKMLGSRDASPWTASQAGQPVLKELP